MKISAQSDVFSVSFVAVERTVGQISGQIRLATFTLRLLQHMARKRTTEWIRTWTWTESREEAAQWLMSREVTFRMMPVIVEPGTIPSPVGTGSTVLT